MLRASFYATVVRMSADPNTLELRERDGRRKHYLDGRPVNGGDLLEVCFSGGWLPMRYEWDSNGPEPRFHFSVELGGGRVWESFLVLPEDALLRWPDRLV